MGARGEVTDRELRLTCWAGGALMCIQLMDLLPEVRLLGALSVTTIQSRPSCGRRWWCCQRVDGTEAVRRKEVAW